MSYEDEVERVVRARVDRLRSATGWLSLVDKIFLGQGTTTLRLPDGSSGTIVVDGNVVTLDGVPMKSDRAGRAEPVDRNGFVLELMERGDTLAIRVRDLRQLPRPFAGIARFAVDPAWRKPARLVAHPEPKHFDLEFQGAVDGAVTDRFESPGSIVFEHDGAEHRLDAVWEGGRKRLLVMFRDGTTGRESYPLGRLLYTSAPDEGGAVVIDFNLAMIPGCAFTVFATCPIPPPQNRLPIAIRAGERFYEGKSVGEP